MGLVFYLSVTTLGVIALLSNEETQAALGALALGLFVLGLALDVYLLSVQAFSIKAFCKLCLTTYGLNAAAAALLFSFRKSVKALPGLWARADARPVVAGWAIASVAFVFGVVGVEKALAERENVRNMSILGAPIAAVQAAAATAEPTGSSSLAPSDLKAAQEEIKRLKATLDDPDKYEQYQHDKSIKEFMEGAPKMIDVSDSPVLGAKAAKIQVTEYADFLCPFCRHLANAFHNYLPTTQGRVAIYYKFFPLEGSCNPTMGGKTTPGHEGACLLAMGGVCAMKQNKFGPYHDKVVRTELKSPGVAEVVDLAKAVGVDEAAFTTCLNAPATKERVTKDVLEGQKAGVTGTPALFINNRRLPRTNDFLDAVEAESQKLGLGPMPKPQQGAHGPH
jgi:protein-disulfide isomerase